MIAVGMVQMTVHQVVDVIAVGDGLVSAAGTVHVLPCVTFASVSLRTFVRIVTGHG